MSLCKGSWTTIKGRNTRLSPAILSDWKCGCGLTNPYKCKIKFPPDGCLETAAEIEDYLRSIDRTSKAP